MKGMLDLPSVTVAVLTFKRPTDIHEALPQLLDQVSRYPGHGRVLVIDNDAAASAADIVGSFTEENLTYVVEATPGIAAARNRALAETSTDLIVFIDDDERPVADWLELLVAEYRKHPGALGVFGLVESSFATEPDPWLVAGRFFERRKPATGSVREVVATNNWICLSIRTTASAAARTRCSAVRPCSAEGPSTFAPRHWFTTWFPPSAPLANGYSSVRTEPVIVGAAPKWP